MSQETIVAIVVAIIGSGGSGVFVTWILSKVTIHCMRASGNCCSANSRLCTVRWSMQVVLRAFRLKQSAERIYAAYHGLGGNGTGTSMIQDIRDAHIANTD